MEIERLKLLKSQNEIIIKEMDGYSSKISKFDETQAILDSATAGTEIWGNMLTNISDFMERRRNFWISNLETGVDKNVSLKGFTLNRSVLTEFADQNNSSLLNTVTFEPLREAKSYSYNLKFHVKKTEQKKMNRKTFSTLLLVAIFAIIAITGSAYTYYFQANDIEDNEKQLKDLKVNAQNTEELEIQLADLKLKIQEMDSILSLRKYVIPTKITQSSFFNLLMM